MKAAIYIRVSTEEQAKEGYSIDAQKKRLIDFVNSQGWELHDFYIDDGFSAKDLNRPHMQRMIRDMKEKSFDVILVYKLDRMVRSVTDLHELLQLFDKYDVKFKSSTEAFETTSAMGRFFITLVGAMAQWERENLAERVKMGMEEKAHKGERNGSYAPYGYKLVDGELVIEPVEAEIVRKIFDMYITKSMNAIVHDLNRSGIKKRNSLWSNRSLGYLLSNPVYIGKIRWNYKKAGSFKTGKEIITDAKHEPIISEEVFNHVQELLQSRRQMGKTATSEYIFSGLLKCARCGRSMKGYYKAREKSATKSYRCGGKVDSGICNMPNIKEDVMEKELLAHLEWEIDRKLESHFIFDEPEKKEDIEKWDEELKKIEKRKKKWQEAFANEAISLAELKRNMAEERAKEELILKKLEDVSYPQQKKVDKREIIEHLKEITSVWDEMDIKTKKQLLQTLFAFIKVDSPLEKGIKGQRFDSPVKIVDFEWN